MNRRSILFAILGLTLGAGATLAAGHIRSPHDGRHSERNDSHQGDDDRYADDEWDDDDEGSVRGSVAAPSGAPSAPLPDNNLFLNGARPKASVQ